jgi:S-adenosylmethionine synthetase
MGRSDLDLPWEALNKVDALKANLAERLSGVT